MDFLPEKLRILAFPQRINGNQLEINVLVLPTQRLLNEVILFPSQFNEGNTVELPQFIKAKPDLKVNLVNGLNNYPFTTVPVYNPPINIPFPANLSKKYEGLKSQFKVVPVSKGAGVPNKDEEGIRKYLPQSYRKAFNFTNPRTPYAKTDDSYHCAITKAPKTPDPVFKNSPDDISWGRVIAFCLRQQLLAESIGLLYNLTVTLPSANYFENGGWVYFNLGDIAPEYNIAPADIEKELKIYAARIPQIDPANNKRQLFAALLFPVVSSPAKLKGQFDALKIEASDYDDGYAKIVHAMQPVSANLLSEEADGIHVQKEAGIRLGWDDEQILIWQNRQWLADPSTPAERIDAPFGVFSYRVDVREKKPIDQSWNSLTRIRSNTQLIIGNEEVAGRNTELETGVQVFPTKINAIDDSFYWLPSYYCQWHGQSLVLPDAKAAQLDGTGALANPGSYSNTNKNNKDEITAKPDQKGGLYDAVLPDENEFVLKYGHEYEFRVRLADLTGGGPRIEENELNDAPATTSAIIVKRYIAPKQFKLVPLQEQPAPAPVPAGEKGSEASQFLLGNEFEVYRPRLGYPALLFTEMDTNTAFQKLLDDKDFLFHGGDTNQPVAETRGVSYFDVDVDKMMVIVEVKSLLMDNLGSRNQREPYLLLYSTFRAFNDNPETPFTLRVDYRNANSIFNPAGDLGDLNPFLANIHDNDAPVILPTSRDIRITLAPVCSEKTETPFDYFGFAKTIVANEQVYAGEQIQFFVRQQAEDETDFLQLELESKTLRGIYLQPDPVQVKNPEKNERETAEGKESEQIPLIMRLASALGLDSKLMTLIGKPGERIIFGCSNRIRHTLAPDNSSITFSAKADFFNHWLCATTFTVNRDWSWDGLNTKGIEVTRKKKFTGESDTEIKETIGYIQFKNTASRLSTTGTNFNTDPDRSYTRIVFIDAVEPKKEVGLPSSLLHPFPNSIDVEYTLAANFDLLNAVDPVTREISKRDLRLPSITIPNQVPKIVAAGMALSPYIHNSDYSETAFRQRYLWFEFEEPIKEPNDAYFARVLTYSPDPLLAFPNPDQLLIKQEDPPLPVDPELIRMITSGESDDFAGYDAMQLMRGETPDPHQPLIGVGESKVHYLLPLPPGLHNESNELFGFFSYEIRVGHAVRPGDPTSLWSTAQGRFGHPAHINGVQHPAPQLKCLVNRLANGITAASPYAIAVFNGKNVTSKPPKTEIWCMLYAQVKQADGIHDRNILLDDRKLEYLDTDVQSKFKVPVSVFIKEHSKITDIKLSNSLRVNLDAPSTGKVFWEKAEINNMLDQYHLSHDSGLSVLAVEMMPRYDQYILQGKEGLFASEGIRPLSTQLGKYRILRTSPLVAAPDVCCDDC